MNPTLSIEVKHHARLDKRMEKAVRGIRLLESVSWHQSVQQQFLADWRTWRHTARYDVILGADILYERAMYAYLEPIFQQNLAPGGCLLLADPCRPQALEFAAHLEKHGWHFELSTCPVTLPATAEQPGKSKKKANQAVEVALLIGRRKG